MYMLCCEFTERLHHQIDHCEDFLFCGLHGRVMLEVNCYVWFVIFMICYNFFM